MKMKGWIKNVLALTLPILLVALAVIQIQMCQNVFQRRNVYLLESLPATSHKIWDTLSGSGSIYSDIDLSPHEYSHAAKNSLGANQDVGSNIHSRGKSFQVSGGMWSQERQKLMKHYRDSVLQTGLPSLTVHFLWCVDGIFDINQYISILSILHQFHPDKIVIHYRIKPRSDPRGYWRWLEDLERDVIMLSLKPLRDARHCHHDLSKGVTLEHFSDPHGIFVLGDVVITNLTRPDVVNLINYSFSHKKEGISIQKHDNLSQSQVFIVPETEPFHLSSSPGHVVISCPSDTVFNNDKKFIQIPCVSMQSYIAPELLFHMESKFYSFVRKLLYSSPKPIDVNLASSTQIPSIVHIVLEKEKVEVSPLLYFSIKSAYKSGKVDMVYIHCQNKPNGELWDRLHFSDHLKPRWIPIAPLTKPNPKQAIKTYLLYTLLQHGGIATLGDIIFTKPVSSLPILASAVISPQKSQYRQKHRSLNTDIIMAAPGSDFIKNVLGMCYQSKQSDAGTDLNDIASHMSEVNPKSVLMDFFLTSNQICQDKQCVLAGGHDPPDMTYTTRLLWKTELPKNIGEFLSVEGPSRSFLSSLNE